jgi:methylmalonyl-CoA/ethylmalonyl-CoA epimerase
MTLTDEKIVIQSIGQVSRSVSDCAESEAWYRDVLGLEHLYTFGSMTFFDCGGVRLMLSQAETPLPAESILYFNVADIRQTALALKGLGVVFVQEPQKVHQHTDGSEEWMGFINDPDKRPIALMCVYRN